MAARITLGATAFALAAVGSLLTAQPADSADTVYGRVEHHSPDAGYDPAILVRCNPDVYPGGGQIRKVREGAITPCADTDYVVIRSGEELWCYYSFSSQGQGGGHTNVWVRKFDATGKHSIDSLKHLGQYCTLRED